ncbi:uncharacterized protein [Mytilus edulis]|uniref:uncharacterized protein n=1 Tax=Mytilus edulis TaxID=6550 RepID=UPI0039EE1AF4
MASSQSVKKGQVPVNCKLCETNRTIQWKCMDCSILMCGYCTDNVHSKFKNATDHKIINLKDVGMHREEMDFTNIKCAEHTEQLSCLYCSKCQILVCPTCITKIHKTHDFIELSDAYSMKVEILKKEHSEMQKSNSKMNVKKNQLINLVSAENIKYSKVREDILKNEKTVKEQVEKYSKELVDKLDQTQRTILTPVKSDLNAISLFINQTEDKINQVQDFIGISDAAEFFKEVMKMENFTEMPELQTKRSYSSSPKFVSGNLTQSNIGSYISLVIINEYRTEHDQIILLSPCLDQSIWLSSGGSRVLQRVKLEENNLKIISQFNIDMFRMAVTPSKQLLLCLKGKTRLQQISSTGELTDSVYDVTPFLPTAIHVISENKVIIGAYEYNQRRGAMIIMNKKGDKETVYKHDKQNQPLFRFLLHITSTSNGHIHVVDKISADFRGKVVILGQEGHIINQYTGHPTNNKSEPFKPVDIVTTPSDNVVVTDLNIPILHILNDNGHLISYFNTKDIGIECPISLAINTTGQLYIGCSRAAGTKTKDAKLYEINIDGF